MVEIKEEDLQNKENFTLDAIVNRVCEPANLPNDDTVDNVFDELEEEGILSSEDVRGVDLTIYIPATLKLKKKYFLSGGVVEFLTGITIAIFYFAYLSFFKKFEIDGTIPGLSTPVFILVLGFASLIVYNVAKRTILYLERLTIILVDKVQEKTKSVNKNYLIFGGLLVVIVILIYVFYPTILAVLASAAALIVAGLTIFEKINSIMKGEKKQ